MSTYNHVQHVVSVNEFRSIADLNGLIGSNDGDSVYVAGYYESINDVPWVKGGGHFVWDSTKLRTEHNGVTVISPTVQWDNTPDTLEDYHAGTLEIEPSGVGCWVRQYDTLNVHMAGAVGDGVVDDTVAIRSMVDYVETFAYGGANNARPSIKFPAGIYKTDSISLNKCISMVGEGKNSSIIRLIDGSLSSLLVMRAENIAGSSLDDTNHYLMQGLTLIGNRVDSTTTGSSHGISCPDAAWSMATQYSSSFIARDIEIHSFTGNGIFLGVNRNWSLIENTIIRYCNDNGFACYSYDNMIINSAFGVCKNAGIRLYAGGANAIINSTIFYNQKSGIIVNDSYANTLHLTNCAIDHNNEHGIYLDSASNEQLHTFINNRFQGNSAGASNTYSDVFVTSNVERVSLVGNQFSYDSGSTPKYLVETVGSPAIEWHGNLYAASGNVPYGTDITNNFDIFNIVKSYASAIKFPATQIASNDPNALDDYEEGVWTPIVTASGGGSATYAANGQVGTYTKIGRTVFLNFRVQITAHSGSGDMIIDSLPFTSANILNNLAVVNLAPINVSSPANTNIIGIVPANASYISLYSVQIGGGPLVNLPLDTSFTLAGSVTYITD